MLKRIRGLMKEEGAKFSIEVTKFLQTHNPTEFIHIYGQGLELAKRHHYRFLQCRFEELLHTTGLAYDPRNYPLPDNEDFSDYIQLLIKNNHKRQGKKVPHRA